MNLKAMAVYCKVVERGVMAHAAAELEMTPAAVTRIIAELEHALGVRLINRTHPQVAPDRYWPALL
jgi:DNA-binding transcriptional LysR family regulator